MTMDDGKTTYLRQTREGSRPMSERIPTDEELVALVERATPGPWLQDRDEDRMSGGLWIHTSRETGDDNDDDVAYIHISIRRHEERLANAALIASAPDLLRSLIAARAQIKAEHGRYVDATKAHLEAAQQADSLAAKLAKIRDAIAVHILMGREGKVTPVVDRIVAIMEDKA